MTIGLKTPPPMWQPEPAVHVRPWGEGVEVATGLAAPSVPNRVEPGAAASWLRWFPRALVGLVLIAACIIGGSLMIPDDEVRLGSAPDLVYNDEFRLFADAPDFTMSGWIDEPGKEVVVHSVTPLTTGNVAYLGAQMATVRPVRGYSNSAIGAGFPQRAVKVTGPIGKPVDVRSQAMVVAGFRLLSGEFGAVNGLEITYSVDGKLKRTVTRHAAIVCFDRVPCAPEGSQWLWENEFLHERGLLDTVPSPY